MSSPYDPTKPYAVFHGPDYQIDRIEQPPGTIVFQRQHDPAPPPAAQDGVLERQLETEVPEAEGKPKSLAAGALARLSGAAALIAALFFSAAPAMAEGFYKGANCLLQGGPVTQTTQGGLVSWCPITAVASPVIHVVGQTGIVFEGAGCGATEVTVRTCSSSNTTDDCTDAFTTPLVAGTVNARGSLDPGLWAFVADGVVGTADCRLTLATEAK